MLVYTNRLSRCTYITLFVNTPILPPIIKTLQLVLKDTHNAFYLQNQYKYNVKRIWLPCIVRLMLI